MFFYLNSYKVQKVDGYKLKSTNWTDHSRRIRIPTKSKKWTCIN